MRVRSWVFVLWFLGGVLSGQDAPAPDREYQRAVVQGRQSTATDAEALKVQALIRESEEAGAYQDGEFEKTEIVATDIEPKNGEPRQEPAPAAPRYSDE